MEIELLPPVTVFNDASAESMPMPEEDFVRQFGFEILDLCEAEIVSRFPLVDLPVTHRFTPGLYSREIFMPAGTLLTSKIHMTEHQFVISQGEVSVWTPECGAMRLQAPFLGITRPGTKRLLYIHQDTIWTTFHATQETDPKEIERQIIMVRHNPLLN